MLLTLDWVFGADSEAIMKKVGALVISANQAASSNHNSEAEQDYKAAIVQCDLLPPIQYYCKTNVLRNLGDFSCPRMVKISVSAAAQGVAKINDPNENSALGKTDCLRHRDGESGTASPQ
jgi:hypothetical protein